MLQTWLCFARGTVEISVHGAQPERFLNRCAFRGIVLRGTRRVAVDEIQTCVSLPDFFRIRQAVRRTQCRVHVLRRAGLPFYTRRLRRRYVLLGGFVGLALLCFVLCRFVWAIEVSVPAGISEREVQETLSSLGVHLGTPVSSLRCRELEQQIRQKLDCVSLAALNLHGNRLTVEVYAATPKPKMLDEAAHVSVSAKKTGVVTRMMVRDGMPHVEIGDLVQAGDTLVSTLMMPTVEEGGVPRLVHARAEVEARTWYDITLARAFSDTMKQYTGKEKTQYALIFGSRRINLYLGCSISDGSCDKIVTEQQAVIGGTFAIPLKFVRQTYRYYDTVAEETPAETQRVQMEEAAKERLQTRIDGRLTASTSFLSQTEGGALLTLHAECLEQIGEERLDDTPLPAPEENKKKTEKQGEESNNT